MKLWRFAAVPLMLFASPAICENWIIVAANEDGASISVDKDSIRRNGDGLVYYTEDSLSESSAEAADCAKRVLYTLSSNLIIGQHLDFSDWRDHGQAVQPNSMGEAELQYACANAG